MRFYFTGKLGTLSAEGKHPFIVKGKTKNKKDYLRLNLRIMDNKNNTAYPECFGCMSDEINTMDVNGNNIVIDWGNRNEESVIEQVANYKKCSVNLTGERGDTKYFITTYDFIEYIMDNASQLTNKTVVISGDVSKNVYNGKITDRFEINRINVVDENTKPGFKVSGEFFWDEDAFDTSDWNDNKKLTITGYTNEYVDKETGRKYFPMNLTFNCSKIDWANEQHVNLVKYKLSLMHAGFNDNGKPALKKAKTIYKQNVILSYHNGAEEIEFDESCLTEVQKEAIQLGFKTLEDFRPAGSIRGDKVVSYNLVDFDMRGDYADGAVDTKITFDDFADNIYHVQEVETLEEVEKKVAESEAKTNNELSEESLFD